MLETAFTILAIIGIVTVIVGRHVMIRDTGSDLPFFWMVALRLVPFADLMYMVRHFADAKKGGIIAVAGMWLMVPHFALERHNDEKALVASGLVPGAPNARHAGSDDDEAEDPAESDHPDGIAGGTIARNTRLLAEKERQTAQLHRLLGWWFGQLEEKRAKAAEDPAALSAFNKEAASYAALNAIAREANDELNAIRGKLAK